MSETKGKTSSDVSSFSPLLQHLYTNGYPPTWELFFAKNFSELKEISEKLIDIERRCEQSVRIYPEIQNIFRAFIPIHQIKLVVLGMDPYHNGSATGLCFSVKEGKEVNASLKNIYAEIERGGETLRRKDGNLEHWREQGCFMLNTALTVNEGRAGSHLRMWKKFTQNVLKHIINNKEDALFLLMGNQAIEMFESCFDGKDVRHYVIPFKTTHPSPLGASKDSKLAKAFIGSCVFRKINEKLREERIEW